MVIKHLDSLGFSLDAGALDLEEEVEDIFLLVPSGKPRRNVIR